MRQAIFMPRPPPPNAALMMMGRPVLLRQRPAPQPRIFHRVGRAHHQRARHICSAILRASLVAQAGQWWRGAGLIRARPASITAWAKRRSPRGSRSRGAPRRRRSLGDGQELSTLKVGVRRAGHRPDHGLIGHAACRRVDIGIGVRRRWTARRSRHRRGRCGRRSRLGWRSGLSSSGLRMSLPAMGWRDRRRRCAGTAMCRSAASSRFRRG